MVVIIKFFRRIYSGFLKEDTHYQMKTIGDTNEKLEELLCLLSDYHLRVSLLDLEIQRLKREVAWNKSNNILGDK